MTQHEQIYKWLLTHKRPMTPFDAFRMSPPCTKLSTRIGEMIKSGCMIGKTWKMDGTRKVCRQYHLLAVKK